MMNTKHKGFKTKVFFWLVLMMISGMSIAQPVSRETARQAAKTFLENNGAQSAELSDVSAAAGFTHLYVFTTGNSFVLLSADSRVQPVLGYSLNGGFDTERMPENKRSWIQEYSAGIQYAIEHQTRATAETSQQWQALLEGDPDAGRSTVVVEPLIQTHWDQGWPYNLFCPIDPNNGNATYTGCVATAMAQVMKYWNYPEHGIGLHFYNHSSYGLLSADFGNTTYDWDNMVNTYSSSTEVQRQAVATLMYHCGVSVNMNYGTGGSGASTAVVADALKTYFNYSNDVQHLDRSSYSLDDWIPMLKTELDQNRPIQYHGTGSGGGHSFVCDGYRDDDHFHFNWGWGGYCDEYYVITNLNPGPGGIGSGNNGIYNDGQGAIIGIHPSECTANAPANLTYTQNGQQVTLTWTAAGGAVHYNIYRNMNLIGTATSTTYTDIALFGNNNYYVRSVDANGEMSLSSNAVTVTVGYQTPIVNDLAATTNENDVYLSWTAPEWCYPETPSDTLTYGNANSTSTSLGFNGSACMYWGHRYPASDLSEFGQMTVYKVSFFAKETGEYQLFVYKGTSSNHPQMQILQQSFTVGAIGWNDIDLSNIIQIDASQDLWVFLFDPEYRNYPAAYCAFDGSEGNYYSTNPTSWVSNWDNTAFLIRTYLTDGVYTYNLYRDGTVIAGPIGDTLYIDSNLEDGSYAYYVKTNYYAGETGASNTVTVTLPGLATQTVELRDGWTWWTPTVNTTLTELETSLGSNGILINSQDDGFARYENGDWSGTLQGFVPGQMYRIETQSVGTITLEGEAIQTNGITFMPGYNWFGYTGRAGLSVAKALGDFVPAEGDQIIGQDGTATYGNGEWTGTLISLMPGKGYIYHSTTNEIKTMTFN